MSAAPRRAARLALALWLSLAAGPARADDAADAQRRAEARDFGAKGDKLWEAGRCDKAIPMWQQAESRFHAPTLVFRIARCEAMLGRVVQATQHFEALVAEPLAPGAPPSWVEAKESAAHWLTGVRERIAGLTVVPHAAQGLVLSAELDGASIALGQPVPADPGRHRLTVRAASEAWSDTVELDDGAQRELRIQATVEPPPPPVLWKRRLGWGLAGGGALLAGVGTLGFGIPALVNAADLRKHCDGTLCAPAAQPAMNAIKFNAAMADLGLGLGLGLAAAGTVILIVSPTPRAEGPRVRIVPLGPGVGVVGTF